MTLISAPPFINKINSTDTKKKRRSFSKLQSINFSFLFTKKEPVVIIVEDDVSPLPGPRSSLAKVNIRPTRPVSQFFATTIIKDDDDKTNIKKCRKSMDFNDARYLSTSVSTKQADLEAVVSSTVASSQPIELPKNLMIKEDSSLSFTLKKKPLSRSATNPKRMSISGATVSRARSVFGLDSIKARENRAISMWKNVVSQLIIKEQEDDSDSDHENHDILLQTSVNPERQRFVQQSVKDLAMVKFITCELVATEESFYKLLLLIKSRYMNPMITASQKKYPLVKSTDIPLLFNHLPELIRISEKLLLSLKVCQGLADIGDTFHRLEAEFVVFLKYAMHYKNNIKAIRKACTNVLFLKIDQETLAKRDSNRLGMADYLIAPIQRIPRYCLLIKDLQKYTHPSYTNYSELNYVLKTLTGLAVVMDHVQQPGTILSTRN